MRRQGSVVRAVGGGIVVASSSRRSPWGGGSGVAARRDAVAKWQMVTAGVGFVVGKRRALQSGACTGITCRGIGEVRCEVASKVQVRVQVTQETAGATSLARCCPSIYRQASHPGAGLLLQRDAGMPEAAI